MTDSILRSYQNYSYTTTVPYPVFVFSADPNSATDLLHDETQGFAVNALAVGGAVAVIDTTTPANDLDDVTLNASNLIIGGTSPKLMPWPTSPFVRWSAHNLFLNSATPATQNVTLKTGFVYTVTVTGAGGGNITGSSGASGTATTGSPATFTATGTTGTFTLTGSLSTIQINRGTTATEYLATTGAIRIGIPQYYSPSGMYGIWIEQSATNLALYSDDFTNAAWTKSNMTTAMTSTGPDAVANSASRLTATSANATALQAITDGSKGRLTSVWVKRITGSGNIDITHDNGSTWNTKTVTADWTRVSIVTSTGTTDPTFGIRIVTSGDAIDVWGFQHEQNKTLTPSSNIPTLGATDTRSGDAMYALTSTFPSGGTAMSAWVYVEKQNAILQHALIMIWDDPGTSEVLALHGVGDMRFKVIDGGVQQAGIGSTGNSVTANTPYKSAFRATTNDIHMAADGDLSTNPDTTATMPTGYTRLRFDRDTDGTQDTMTLYKLVVVPRAYSNAELQAVTT